MKRWLGILLSAAMVASLATGCGSSGGAGDAGSKSAAPASTGDSASPAGDTASGEKTKLTVTYIDTNDKGDSSVYYTWINSVYEGWDKKDQVELDIQPIVAADSDYFTKIQLQMSDAATTPDLVYDDSFQIAADVGAGYLSNLDDKLASWDTWTSGTFTEALKAGVTGGDGGIYAVPAGTDGRGLWYNKNVLASAGVIADASQTWAPKNWEEVLAACRAIKEKGEAVPFFCTAANANAESTSMNTYEMIYYGTGEQLFDKTTGLWTVRSQGILDSLTFLQTIFNEELTYDMATAMDINSGNTAAEDFTTDSLGIMLNGTWVPNNYLETGMFPWPEYKDVIDLAPMPTQKGDNGGLITMSGGWAWAIPAKSQNQEMAFEFMKALYDNRDAYSAWCIGNGQIAVLDLSDHADYMNQPFMDKIMPLFEQAIFRPFSEKYSGVSSYISAMVEAAVTGTDADKAMEDFANGVIGVVGEDQTQDLLNA